MKIENTSNPVASALVREARNRSVSHSSADETDDVQQQSFCTGVFGL